MCGACVLGVAVSVTARGTGVARVLFDSFLYRNSGHTQSWRPVYCAPLLVCAKDPRDLWWIEKVLSKSEANTSPPKDAPYATVTKFSHVSSAPTGGGVVRDETVRTNLPANERYGRPDPTGAPAGRGSFQTRGVAVKLACAKGFLPDTRLPLQDACTEETGTSTSVVQTTQKRKREVGRMTRKIKTSESEVTSTR